MRAPDFRPTVPPVLPEGPAGYRALVHAIASAQDHHHPDPVAAAVQAFAQAAQAAWQARLAARLGLRWPLPDAAPTSTVPMLPLAWAPAWPGPGPELTDAIEAGQRWLRAAAGLVAHFDDLARTAQSALAAELIARPVRSLPALHTAFLRAWHAAHTRAVNAPDVTAHLHALGHAGAQALHQARRLLPSLAAVGH